jgi:adenine/guanine phosphoribosyltransferase-like PRPP-binding protein
VDDMTDGRARELIARGQQEREASGGDDSIPKYNGLSDPPGAEELGRLLAERSRDAGATVVAVWEDPEDVVLGHVVGRELGLPVVRTYDADGLVGTGGPLPTAPRILLVADAVRDARVVRSARALAAREHGALVAAAVLVDSAALQSVAREAGTVVALQPAPETSAATSTGAAATVV